MATRMNRRQRGRHNLFRMLAGGVGARKKHIDRTRERTRSELMRQQQLAEAKEQQRIRDAERGSGFGRGLQTALKVGSLLATGGVSAPWVVGGGLLAGGISALAPAGADPYLQQGLAMTQSMQGHQKQMELMDRQLAAQEAHMSSILQSLQSGRSAYASAPQFPAEGFTGRSNHPYDSPMWDT